MKFRSTLLALVAACGCASTPAPEGISNDGRYAMGTALEISLVSPDGFTADELGETFEDLFALAARVDALLADSGVDSDVRRLNANAGGGPLEVDSLVSELLSQSIVYSRLTQGAFDFTAGSLVELWTAATQRGELPSKDALADARERVGTDGIAVHGDGRVEILRRGTSLNLGGIAKGFAPDQMVPRLRRKAVASALLSFGQSNIAASTSTVSASREKRTQRFTRRAVIFIVPGTRSMAVRSRWRSPNRSGYYESVPLGAKRQPTNVDRACGQGVC